MQAAKLSTPRGRKKDNKRFWNQRLGDLHKQLNTARDALEERPTNFSRQVHKKAKKLYEMENHSQSERNWFEKTSSLNIKKDTKKLWHLTKAVNEDNIYRSQTVLLIESGPVAGKAACKVLANAYKIVSEVENARSRIHDIQRKTNDLRNIDVPSPPFCTLDRLIMKELDLALLHTCGFETVFFSNGVYNIL